jgi:hypothetical protein
MFTPKFFSRGWVKVNASSEVYCGSKSWNTELLSKRLFLKSRETTPPLRLRIDTPVLTSRFWVSST